MSTKVGNMITNLIGNPVDKEFQIRELSSRRVKFSMGHLGASDAGLSDWSQGLWASPGPVLGHALLVQVGPLLGLLQLSLHLPAGDK